MIVNHAKDCGWHLDQYDFECSCGATVRHKLDRLEQLASPAALLAGDSEIAGSFCRIMNSNGFLEELRRAEHNHRIGKWLSAALDDPKVCDEMKSDIRKWMGDEK